MIAFYVSGHGFGHAARVIEIINALHDRRPDLGVHVRTSASRWLFDLTARGAVSLSAAEVDVGVVQIDSLTPDVDATIDAARRFYTTWADRVDNEAAWLGQVQPSLVVADVPPLGLAAAARAGVPSVALGNFTWDWIYEAYPEWPASARWVIDRIREAHARAVEAWRLPLSGGFAGFRRIRDLPFIARHSHHEPTAVRDALGLPRDTPLVLVSFGGFGLEQLPLESVARAGRHVIVTTRTPTANESAADEGWHQRRVASERAGVVVVDERALYGQGWRYEDLVAAADVVVSKPGYGIISECIANGTALLYTSRGRFAEYDVLVESMPRYLRSAFIRPHELRSGLWTPHLDRLLLQAPPPPGADTSGAAVAASLILGLIG